MDPGSRSDEVIASHWRRATLAWMLIILAETVHGAIREIFIAPALGDLRARQLGVGVGCVIIFGIAWFAVRWIGARNRATLLGIGLMWVCLTLAFEMAFGRAVGASWDRILADYNPARGGLMIFGLIFMCFAPWLAARLRRLDSGDRQ
jgi:hypothetical protein